MKRKEANTATIAKRTTSSHRHGAAGDAGTRTGRIRSRVYRATHAGPVPGVATLLRAGPAHRVGR